MVTLRDHPVRLTSWVKHCRWGLGGPSLPGPQPDLGGAPHGHHVHVHSCRRRRVRVHRARATCPGWVPGRLQRPDPSGYELDLRQYASWCQQHHLRLFQVRCADIECFARDLEARGRARATITRRLCTLAGFYRYAVEEELLDHSPAAHVRRPRLDYESHATGLGHPTEHALISLLALNGLRVSEATGANIEALGVERGHRTLVITRKGGKVVTIPLAPRTARAIDLAIGERSKDRSSWLRMAAGWTGAASVDSAPGAGNNRTSSFCRPATVAMATVALVPEGGHDGGTLRLDDDTADQAGHAG